MIVPGYLILYALSSLYTPKRMHGQRYEIFNIIRANAFGLLIIIFVLYLIKLIDFSRVMMFLFCVLNILYEIIARVFLRMLLRSIRRRGFNQKHIVLVGYSRAAEGYIDRVKMFPQWGYGVVGILDDNVEIGKTYRGEKVIGRVEDIESVLNANDIDEIAITLGLAEYAKLEKVVAVCEKSGVHTKFIPDYNNIIPTRPYIEDVQGLPVINIRRVPLNGMFNRAVKRLSDIVIGSIAIVLFSPVMLIVALIVRCSSRGPVIYKQERVGRHNKEFKMYKFRSMRVENDGSDKSKWTTPNDPRVTGFGKFIRKTSLDELPQFFNVLFGDMSLVGTRPPTVDEFKQYESYHKRRLSMKPGITGMWQVSGRSNIEDFEEVVKLDLEYIDNWSIGLDIKILFKTIAAIFKRKGAK